jgi:hypothetical protein
MFSGSGWQTRPFIRKTFRFPGHTPGGAFALRLDPAAGGSECKRLITAVVLQSLFLQIAEKGEPNADNLRTCQ